MTRDELLKVVLTLASSCGKTVKKTVGSFDPTVFGTITCNIFMTYGFGDSRRATENSMPEPPAPDMMELTIKEWMGDYEIILRRLDYYTDENQKVHSIPIINPVEGEEPFRLSTYVRWSNRRNAKGQQIRKWDRQRANKVAAWLKRMVFEGDWSGKDPRLQGMPGDAENGPSPDDVPDCYRRASVDYERTMHEGD